MGLITNITRSWLTRSAKPFTFRSEYDDVLPYGDCESLGLYVHIPFCRSICSFCPYCKTIWSAEKMDKYIDALLDEIRMVGGSHSGRKRVTSLYFGGGTPALAADRIGEIINELQKYRLPTTLFSSVPPMTTLTRCLTATIQKFPVSSYFLAHLPAICSLTIMRLLDAYSEKYLP